MLVTRFLAVVQGMLGFFVDPPAHDLLGGCCPNILRGSLRTSWGGVPWSHEKRDVERDWLVWGIPTDRWTCWFLEAEGWFLSACEANLSGDGGGGSTNSGRFELLVKVLYLGSPTQMGVEPTRRSIDQDGHPTQPLSSSHVWSPGVPALVEHLDGRVSCLVRIFLFARAKGHLGGGRLSLQCVRVILWRNKILHKEETLE